MKVLTILCALMFVSGLIFADENMKIQQVQLRLEEAIDLEDFERKLIVEKDTTRAPAVIDFEVASHTVDVEYWFLKI